MIELFNHARFDIPSVAQTSIEFYGTMGLIMYFLIVGFALYGLWNAYIKLERCIK